ncbi:MAG: hypothetical protein KatS3mg102_0735 [Planctomycetota bacterium]|nr:MAG: hypothetical protein KatS3mg102_0735 [Planctomycetota bacterium]
MSVLGLGGCSYLSDRAADLVDVFTVEVGFGPGLHADLKATDWLHLGVGYAQLRKAGLRGRDAVWMRDREVGLPLSALLWVGAWREGALERLGHLHADVPDLLAYPDPWRRADLELGLSAGLVSVRLGLSPGQLLDFLAGLFGFDPAGDDRGPPLAPPPSTAGMLWLAGDLHAHVTPPDPNADGHVTISPEQTVALAACNGLDFVGLHPHLWAAPHLYEESFQRFAERLQRLGEPGRRPVVLPGFELTGPAGHALLVLRRPEHALLVGELERRQDRIGVLLERVPARDRLLVPTHPLTHRLRIPFFPDYARPWREPEGGSPAAFSQLTVQHYLGEPVTAAVDGLEALTLLHHLGELAVGRRGEELALDAVFRALDARIAAQRRRQIATGGSDNHRELLVPTLWVLARGRDRDAIFEALAGGRIVVGGPEARSFMARTELEPHWQPVGAALRAERRVELRWRGRAALVIDGERRVVARGGYVHAIEPQSFHFYRLEAGPGRRSRSNWIYVNLPAQPGTPPPDAPPAGGG